MESTALSRSFHGNLLLWKQALEQTQELGGGDFVAGEAEGGEAGDAKNKTKTKKHGEWKAKKQNGLKVSRKWRRSNVKTTRWSPELHNSL